jgi:predicted transcriptional regulator
MVKILREYIVRKLREPTEKELDQDIKWVCNSLGFITLRDQDNTAFKILKALIISAKDGKGLTSEELSHFVQPTVGSVIYHLKRLIKAGLIIKINSNYELRMGSLVRTIEEIEKEMTSTLSDVKKVSDDIDTRIGLERRN